MKLPSLFLKICSVLLSTQILFAQQLTQTLENSLFWKIEGKELKEPSYLFGTIHLIPASDYFLPDGIIQAITDSRKVFMEIDVDQMNDLGAMMTLMDKIVMNNDTSLTDLVNKDEYQLLQSYFEKIGLPLSMFERIKPMFLSAMAGVDGNPFALKDGSSKSYELELAEIARTHNKEIDGLESLEFQISIFDSIPYNVQAKMLLDAVSSAEKGTEEMKSMIQSYKNQDLNALNQTVSSEDQHLNPYLEMMLYNRNKNWIPIMKLEMAKGSNFFAVGAGHLGGDKGVIHLLKNEGYKVSPIKQKP
ncbi:MAG: TraB/GumN family protein [Saprospiraceae bacterium]|nr:TraB/GumN family protein [Saprospiraceae bacterium]MBK8451395.1 TraB/GumN family protein [Saprospiraceae bacterium]MBK8483354.1 TraB/GumN family protein [Saprospiraceae bacterium]MBK9220868.1 TraB/GumN family protein [Saprospiraceae bacterium]MBK9722287.1 TraB/GumN family protein [Saprospiraceae bacterium]